MTKVVNSHLFGKINKLYDHIKKYECDKLIKLYTLSKSNKV